jgi:hypothetical protein
MDKISFPLFIDCHRVYFRLCSLKISNSSGSIALKINFAIPMTFALGAKKKLRREIPGVFCDADLESLCIAIELISII